MRPCYSLLLIQGCGSFRKWDCSVFYKNSEVIFPLWPILGKENRNGREGYVFLQGGGAWEAALTGVQECFCNRAHKHNIHDHFVEWKNQWLAWKRTHHQAQIPRLVSAAQKNHRLMEEMVEMLRSSPSQNKETNNKNFNFIFFLVVSPNTQMKDSLVWLNLAAIVQNFTKLRRSIFPP